MRPTVKSDAYPFFEPNQILSADNLNQSFDYLDEQERLTRANLIGIGIVCRLNIAYTKGTNASITISRGLGVTSEGYLILEPADVNLVAYQEYSLPGDIAYAPFVNGNTGKQYQLWELLTEQKTNTTSLGTSADFLKNKAVLLFLELRKEGLRNCTPGNCDDNGTEVSAQIRRLLINREDLDDIIAAARALNSGISSAEIAESVKARLNLKDICPPRYDVPATKLVKSSDVLMAFVTAIQELSKYAEYILGASYKTFQPVIDDVLPPDSVKALILKVTNYKKLLEMENQVVFLEYYYDFMSDIVHAYDELRWKGLELLCACNPPEELFPRHLMLGLLEPDTVPFLSPEKFRQSYVESPDVVISTKIHRQPFRPQTAVVPDPGNYRQPFVPSPAISPCNKLRGDVRQLFQRLVEIIESFEAVLLDEIRITPSSYGKVPLSEKAIPCYFSEQRTPQLYTCWDPVKTRRNRANENLSYRSDEYKEGPPPFVADPLKYDIEPYNFLRIEGHLGRNYQKVLARLDELKKTKRLPFEFIALRTGTFDATVPLDLSKERCEFQDLVTLYKTLREELLSNLCEGLILLYDVPFENAKTSSGSPQLTLLKEYAPGYSYHAGTVGAWYETILDGIAILDKFELSSDNVVLRQRRLSQLTDFFKMKGLSAELSAIGVLIYFVTRFAAIFPDNIFSLSPADMNNRYQDIQDIVIYSRILEQSGRSTALEKFIAGRYFTSKLGSVKALYAEYIRRVREAKQKQFFSFFVKNNPGIQHGAGVPVGGTFVLVYHGSSDTGKTTPPAAAAVAEQPAQSISFVTEFSPIIAEAVPMEVKMGKVAFSEAATTPSAAQEVSIAPVYTVQAEMAPIFVMGTPAGSGKSTAAAPESPAAAPAYAGDATRKKFLDRTDYVELRKFAAGNAKLAGIIDKMAGFFVDDPIDPGVSQDVDVFDLLEPGVVIADFFLPYICCSDCTPVQYLLPRPAIDLSVEFGCTGPGGAEVKLTSSAGVPALTYRLDSQAFTALQSTIMVSPGAHTVIIRDSEGSESAVKSFTIPEMLTIGKEEYIEDSKNQTYQIKFAVSGGTAPYKAETSAVVTGAAARKHLLDARLSSTISKINQVTTGGSFADSIFTSDPIKYGQGTKVTIIDSVGCNVAKDFASPVRYALAVVVNPSGSGSVVRKPDSATYSPGTQVTLHAQAGNGYLFNGWSGDVSGEKSTVAILMNSDKKISAVFALNTVTLTYTAGTGGAIKGKSPQTVEFGGSGSGVTATPDTGYRFAKWSDGQTTASRTDTKVTADGTFTAKFEINTYTLTYSAGTGGAIKGSALQTVKFGDDGATVKAQPNEGYKFVKWSDGKTTLSRTDTKVTADGSFTANFEGNSHTLTYTAGGGGTISGTPTQTVPHGGDGTTVTAKPNTGYKFVKWSDGNTTLSRTDTKVTADGSFTANFVPEQVFTLTVAVEGQGAVTLKPSGGTYPRGTSVALTATAAQGWKFDHWGGPVANPESPQTTILMSKNQAVVAFFTKIGGTAPAAIVTATTPAATTIVAPPTPRRVVTRVIG